MNWGYALVDKIPAAGAVTQVILADKALRRFSEAIDIDETWLALYTRGNSYVYWPAIFGRTKLGIADLDKAVELSASLDDAAPAYHAHAYAALGDGYWRLGDLETAHEWWRKGLRRFPDDPELAERLMLEGGDLDAYLDAHYAIGSRVDTSLDELWQAAAKEMADGSEDDSVQRAPSAAVPAGDGTPGDAGR
jgi:tetratricopeptide (TPR) repeat protein